MKKIWHVYKSSLLLLASILLGGVAGYFWGAGALVLKPAADLFLNLLYCCVVPLIFCSLSSAIAKMQNLAKLRKILLVFLMGTVITGVISCLFMVVAVVFFDPAKGAVIDMTHNAKDLTGSIDIVSMFTVNDFPHLFSKDNLMALIVFTIIFAVAIILSGEKGKPVLNVLESLSSVVEKLIGIVMKFAPIGLGCYFAILIGTSGKEVMKPLTRAIIIFLVVGLIYFIVSQTILAYLGAGAAGVKRWWKTAVVPTLTALGTSSSAASLPANMVQAKELGIPEDVADIILPLGANLHKDGACLVQILKIAFMCSFLNIEYMTFKNILLSIIVSVIASAVIGGIPTGGYIGEIFIVSAFGFPSMAIPVMVLLGTITDAPATAINITGDTGLAMVTARIVNGNGWLRRF